MKTQFNSNISKYKLGIALFISFMSIGSMAQAVGDFEMQWQQNVLTSPTQTQLLLEQQGHIVILDGLTDKMVNQVLDTQFERLESLMFTRVVVTNEDGEPIKDPVTGQELVEDDGC